MRILVYIIAGRYSPEIPGAAEEGGNLAEILNFLWTKIGPAVTDLAS
jgi:hypothetical protein